MPKIQIEWDVKRMIEDFTGRKLIETPASPNKKWEISRKQLLASPVREWDKTSEYDAILLVPTGRKHDSGYAMVAIVGLTGQGEARTVEIAGYADDINWHIEPKTDEYRANLRNDCYYPSGIMHFWSEGKQRFQVGPALSSTSIYVTGGGK